MVRAVAAVRGTRARILVNDRPDVALAAGAHGVHLRGDSAPARRVRAAVPPSFLIGRSVHSLDEIAQVSDEGSVDYLLFGTVFATASKPDRPASGIAGLAEAVNAAVACARGRGVKLTTAGCWLAPGAQGLPPLASLRTNRKSASQPRSLRRSERGRIRAANGDRHQDAAHRLFRRGDVAGDVRLLAAQGALAARAHEQLALLVLLVRSRRTSLPRPMRHSG